MVDEDDEEEEMEGDEDRSHRERMVELEDEEEEEDENSEKVRKTFMTINNSIFLWWLLEKTPFISGLTERRRIYRWRNERKRSGEEGGGEREEGRGKRRYG